MILQAIERRDPSGFRGGPPTDADFQRHEQWARQSYGDKAWGDYHQPRSHSDGAAEPDLGGAHQAASAVSCQNCGHTNPQHRKGALCPCGCQSYQPRSHQVGAAKGRLCGTCEGAGCKACGDTGTVQGDDYDTDDDGNMKRRVSSKDYGPSYDPSSVAELPLHGSVTGTSHYYSEGYEHGRTGADRKGYGSRDKSLCYSQGYQHGQADAHVKVSSFDERLAMIRQALMEGQDPLTWIQQMNPPGGPQYAEKPGGHNSTQVFEGEEGNAYREALDGNPGANPPENEVGHQERQAAREHRPF